MTDALFLLLTLICFGGAHVYTVACDKLNVKARVSRD
jgi:hypothetical protein